MKIKKASSAHPLIAVRYIFPFVIYITLITLSLVLPCVRFTLDSDSREKMSVFELLDNSWNSARQYLFSAQTNQTNDGALFYKILFAAVIISVILFAIALAADIFSTAVYITAYKNRAKTDGICRSKILYQTLIPNRIVLSALRLLALPVLFFPDLVAYLYRKILLYPVTVDINAKIPALVVASLLLISFVITAVAKRYEIRDRLNVFAIGTPKVSTEEDTYDEEDDQAGDSNVYTMNDDSQNVSERIRHLFDDDDN